MSNLRIFGIIVGLSFLLITFLKYRGPKWKRSNFVISSLFNLCLIVICINPESVNFARDMLSLQEYQYGRLIALLIVSNIFLFIFSLYSKARQEELRTQLDRLVRTLSASKIGQGDEVQEKLKPIMVVIPAYNESENLKDLLPRMPANINGTQVGTLIVDDGSEDETTEIVRKHGHIAVSNLVNRGGGAALRLGYDILKKSNTSVCVTMDADGQHRPEEIERLVLPILNNRYDFVIGSRMLGGRERDNPFRIIGVRFFGALISSLIGKKITDPSSGFRAFKVETIDLIQINEDQYHTSELIIEAVKKGLRVGEVPITILKRRHGKSKKGKDWMYGLHFARIIVNTWWRPK